MQWLLSLILICGAYSQICLSQISIHDMDRRLDTLMHQGMDSMAFPGAQILVRHKDRVIYHRKWGYHTYDASRQVQFDDLYDMASVTKVSTGLPILMKLHGEGKVDLDAPISKYISILRRGNKKQLTLRQILSHQAKLQPYIVFWQQALNKKGTYKRSTFASERSSQYPIKITEQLYMHKRYRKKMHKAIRKSELRDEMAYLYSGLIFLMMPEMITALTGQTIDDYLYTEIYAPIGATTLTYNPLDRFPLERIIPTEYDTVWRHQLVHGTVHDEAAAMLGGISCNAGLFGTAEDLSKLFQLYLNDGEWEGQQLIDPQSVALFTQYQYADNRRGLGFDKPLREYNADASYIAKDASPASFGHSGFTGTFVWADPAYDLVVVFLSNRVYPDRSHRKLYSLSIRPQLHQLVYDFIKS